VTNLTSQLRYTIRVLLKSPGFTITVILILAFGIGANTAIFSFIHGVVLKPLAYRNAGRLMLIVQTFRNFDTAPLNYADYLGFKAGQHSFEDLAVSSQNTFTLTGQGEPERIKPPLCRAAASQVAWIYHHYCLDHGTWYRREYRNLQRGPRGVASIIAVS
jgi:hypothetical protein